MVDKPKVHSVPVFQLYGEAASEEELSTLHVESLATRSGLHDWEIRPHRHAGLHQLFLVEEGGGQVTLDDVARTFRGPCLIALPPLVVHGFTFHPGSEGHVVTVSERLVTQLSGAWGEGGLSGLLASAVVQPLGRPNAQLAAAFEGLAGEFRRLGPWRTSALTARLGLLLIEIARSLPDGEADAEQAPPAALMRAFRALVEHHAADHWTVAQYAAALSITKARLNALCQRFTGRSPLQLVHDRLLLEAKRNLIHTSMSVGEISYALGFREPAYFCRFFARLAGSPPSVYRRLKALAA